MSPEEKFMFDLEGYLVVRGALAADEVERLNGLADEVWPGEYDDKGMRSTSPVSRWGTDFLNLIDHPRLVPYQLELLGPKFRLDHDYSIFMRQSGINKVDGQLHGGPQGGLHPEGDHWYRYHDGVMRNGLMVFTYCLSDAKAGDGGFACVPGSHKSNFVQHMPPAVRSFEEPAHYVAQPAVEAGDVIIFTEALVHGTQPWKGTQERRSLLYKFSPGHSAWGQGYYDPENYGGISEQQRRIMAPPSVGNRPDSIEASA
ncbi:MAG: phytanoyl-CoA dioxygenase family protein [Candidatus Latescibacterota bacterium]|jgi:hypothetical protein